MNIRTAKGLVIGSIWLPYMGSSVGFFYLTLINSGLWSLWTTVIFWAFGTLFVWFATKSVFSRMSELFPRPDVAAPLFLFWLCFGVAEFYLDQFIFTSGWYNNPLVLLGLLLWPVGAVVVYGITSWLSDTGEW